MIIIYSTFPTKSEAEKIGRQLVERRLAACVNVFKIDSIYQWQGKIEKSGEFGVFIKTKPEKFKKIEQFILKHHSYETPCILEVRAGRVGAQYRQWVEKRVDA
jgi:periplasmic divalent cation tolerance protein